MAVHIEFRASATDTEDGGMARWLKMRLEDSGITVGAPAKYDWGFELPIHANGGDYFAGLPTRRTATSHWHVFVERRRSLRDRVAGKAMPADEPMAMLIKEIITRDPQLELIRLEEQE
jgi:hypothetical protein